MLCLAALLKIIFHMDHILKQEKFHGCCSSQSHGHPLVAVYTDWIVKVFLPGSIKPGRWLITIKVLSSKGPPLVTPLMINRYKSIPNHTALVMKMMIMEVLWSFSYCPGPNYQQIKVNTRSVLPLKGRKPKQGKNGDTRRCWSSI